MSSDDNTSPPSIPKPLTLTPPGQREVVDQKRALEIIDHWTEILLAHRTKIERSATDDSAAPIVLCDKIVLADKSYTAEAARELASFLTSTSGRFSPSIISDVTIADISDVIASRHEDEGLKVLETFSDMFSETNRLVEVDLSDNAMGSKGVTACRNLLGGRAVIRSLERLSLCNDGLSEFTMGEVADFLTVEHGEDGCIAGRLRKIHFYNNMSGDEGGVAFARILEKCTDKKLEDVRFSGTRARAKGSEAAAKALEALAEKGHLENVTRLDLADNTLGDCSEAIAKALSTCKKLVYINLKDCVLRDEGVTQVCAALKEAGCSLVHLDLSGNEITPESTKDVASILHANKDTLQYLNLEENEMTSIGVRHVATKLESNTLETINLDENECGKIGAAALAKAAPSLPALKSIHLDRNSFPEDSVAELELAFGSKLGELEDNDDEDDLDQDLEDEDVEEDNDDTVDDLAGALAGVTV